MFPARSLTALALLLSAGAWTSLGPSPALAEPAGAAAVLTNEDVLAKLIWAQNPEVRQARLAEGMAQADIERARRLANPTVDLGAGTVPLGGKVINYPGMDTPAAANYNPPLPFGMGPNFTVGITQPYELGKRGVRLDRAQVGLSLARLQTLDLHKQRTADAMGAGVRLAAAELRMALLERQLASVRDLVDITRLSAKEGFAPPLDAEKLQLEQGRLQTLLDTARLARETARLDWTRLTLTPPPAIGPQDAEAVFTRLTALPARWPDVRTQADASPMLRLLALQRQQAGLDLTLAERMRLPDLAVRLGYTYDTLPGNPVQYMGASVAFNVPVFQTGQAERTEAASREALLAGTSESLATSVAQQEAAIRARAVQLTHTLDTVQTQRLAAARATLARLEKALRARGIPLSDVIQVRRTVLDLEADRVDLLEQLGATLVDYRRLLAWRLPDPEGVTP